MLMAINKNSKISELATVASKNNIYLCPECNSELVLRQGEHNLSHFAHKSDSFCGYGSGESKEHNELKYLFFEYFKKEGIFVELEKKFDFDKYKNFRRADIYFEYNNKKYVIEIQRSRYTCDEYKQRTEDYLNNNIKLIWVCLIEDTSDLQKKNLNYSSKCNGGHLLYFFTKQLNLNYFYKRFNETKIIFSKDYYNCIELIDFIIEPESFYYEEAEINTNLNEINNNLEELRVKLQKKKDDLDSINEKKQTKEQELSTLEQDYIELEQELEQDYIEKEQALSDYIDRKKLELEQDYIEKEQKLSTLEQDYIELEQELDELEQDYIEKEQALSDYISKKKLELEEQELPTIKKKISDLNQVYALKKQAKEQELSNYYDKKKLELEQDLILKTNKLKNAKEKLYAEVKKYNLEVQSYKTFKMIDNYSKIPKDILNDFVDINQDTVVLDYIVNDKNNEKIIQYFEIN